MLVQAVTRRALTPQMQREVLRQNAPLRGSAERARCLELLADPELGVVVAGQQVGLFLGPALAFYKAATAVALAKRLDPSRPTLPVFWLQSEDHDGAEVQSAHVLDAGHNLRRVTLEPTGDPRACMAERALGPGVTAALDEFAKALEDAPFRDDALDLLSTHYRSNATWVEAFGGTLAQAFGDEGLLMFNPRTQAVAESVAPIHRRALRDHDAVDAALLESARTLQRAGQSPVVKPRPGCSLSFFHAQGRASARHRLQHTAAGWKDPATQICYSTTQLVERLAQDPLSFSTSALLRVITQQTLLPVLAQVAGPAEARYLQQLPPLLRMFGSPAPDIVARARLVVSDARSHKRLARLGLRAATFDHADSVLQRLADSDTGSRGDDIAKALRALLQRKLDELAPELVAIDPNLERALQRTEKHIAKGVTRLGARVDRARARHHTNRAASVDQLARVLTPGGQPQERCLGSIYFIAHWGLQRFKAAVFSAVEKHLDALDSGGPSQLIEVTE